jgi:CRISPR-associated endonuclease/helicase Cas3
MHQRLRRTLGTGVGLLHGRATQALYRLLLRDGYESDRAEQIARRATDLARLQRPAVHVATPYQLLRAAYRLRGYEMTWAALHGALLVVDEVHAYDPSRLGLLLGMLAHLVHRWDARVCTLTATMPSWLQTLLLDRLGATFITASDDDFRAFARHELHLVPGDLLSALPAIVERVRGGQAVLVGANTVGSAQTIYRALQEVLGKEQVRLLHSRFTGRDRFRKENELMELVGLYSSRRVALAVVATQTIEVSLNLDFDTIYTEPAPLEALAQRFGRVNRTRRLIRAPVYVLTEPDDGQHVYDSRLVRSTLATLARRDGQLLDESELSRMLDEVYGGGMADEFQREVIHHELIFARSCLGDLRAFESDDELADQFDQLFDGVEIVPLSLVQEFQQALARSVLDAQGVLVPITHRHLKRFERAGRVKRVSGSFIAIDAPYDNEIGLLLSDE